MLGFKEHQEVLEEKRLKQDPDLKKKTKTGKSKSVPAKTYKGLSKSTKEARHAHFEKNKDKADNDPSAYEPAPGDGKHTGKESKYTKAVHKKYPQLRQEEVEMTEEDYVEWLSEHYDFEEDFENTIEESAGDKVSVALKKKAEASGVSASILRAVFNRGMAAYKGSHRPNQSQHGWAHARVNAFLTPGSGARKADADLWARHTASKKKKGSSSSSKKSSTSKKSTSTKKSTTSRKSSGGKAKLHP